MNIDAFDALVGTLPDWCRPQAAGASRYMRRQMVDDNVDPQVARYRTTADFDRFLALGRANLLDQFNQVGIEDQGAPTTLSPVLHLVQPLGAKIGHDDVTMHCWGAGFLPPQTLIVFNGGDETTTFVNENHMKTSVEVSGDTFVPTPGVYPVYVRSIVLPPGLDRSQTLTFTMLPADLGDYVYPPITDPPTLDSIIPDRASLEVGTVSLTLVGSNFTTDATLRYSDPITSESVELATTGTATQRTCEFSFASFGEVGVMVYVHTEFGDSNVMGFMVQP